MIQTRTINIKESNSGKRFFIALSVDELNSAISITHMQFNTFVDTSVFLHHKCDHKISGGWDEEAKEFITPSDECNLHNTGMCQLEEVWRRSVDKFIPEILEDNFDNLFIWMLEVITNENPHDVIWRE